MLVGFLLAIVTTGNCWWDVGHMLTAAVTQIQLQATAPDVFQQINSLITSINPLCDGRSNTFIESAVWPDDIKGTTYGMGLWNDWHFLDSPYIYDGTVPIINYTQAASNGVYIVQQSRKVLSQNKLKTTAQRALLARYLVHLTGDLHQPLHCVALFNKTYPKGDQGGNLLKIKLPDNSTLGNFHSYWDAGAYQLQDASTPVVRPLSEDDMNRMLERAGRFLEEFREEIGGLGEVTEPAEWAYESFRVAMNTTYPHMMGSQQANKEYVDLSYWTARKRVTLGGLRLASILKQIYKTQQGEAGELPDRRELMAGLINKVKGSQQL